MRWEFTRLLSRPRRGGAGECVRRGGESTNPPACHVVFLIIVLSPAPTHLTTFAYPSKRGGGNGGWEMDLIQTSPFADPFSCGAYFVEHSTDEQGKKRIP